MNIRKEKTAEMFKRLYYITWDCIEGEMGYLCAIDLLRHYIEQVICFAPRFLRRRMKRYQKFFDKNPMNATTTYRLEASVYGLLCGLGVKKTFFVNHNNFMPHGFKKAIPLTAFAPKLAKRDKQTARELKNAEDYDMTQEALDDLGSVVPA